MRSEAKLRYPLTHIAHTVQSHPSYDVYLFNHARVQSVVFWNVWTQGEHFHPGISDVARALLETSGYDPEVVDAPMSPSLMCFCSYFVGTRAFWERYLQFVDTILAATVTLPPELNAIYEGSAHYTRDMSLGMFPFLVERLFSTYLLLHKDTIHWYSEPYDYSLYTSDVTAASSEQFRATMQSLHDAKVAVAEAYHPEALRAWATQVAQFFRERPHQLFLDG